MLTVLASFVFLVLGAAQNPATAIPPMLVGAMRGVDPILFNSLYQPNPGIKNQIFDPVQTASSSTQTFTLNSFIKQEEAYKCAPELSVERVQNYNQFTRVLSSIFFCDTEADETPGVAAAGLYSETKPSCSRENIRKELAVQQFFQVTGGEILLVTAECTTHTVSISPFEPPVFTPSFQRAVQILDSNFKYSNGESTDTVFLEFLKFYGSHFSRMTHMGAKAVFLKRFSSKSVATWQETVRRRCMTESAYETLTPGRRRSNETTIMHFSRASSERCGGEMEDVSGVIIGPLPDSSLQNWASVVKEDPKPIYFRLERISNWFTNSWFQDPLDEYQNDLNATALHKYFQDTSSYYCDQFTGGVCQHPLKGCGFNSDCPPQQNCLDALETDQGYKCVEKEYAGIVIVGGKRCEAIGTSEPPAYPGWAEGNTLSLVGSTLYSCGGTDGSGYICRYLRMNDTTWYLFRIPWSLYRHSAVTIASDIWFFTSSKLYIHHTDGSNQRYNTYDIPFSFGQRSSCAVSNGSHTFVIGHTSEGNELWLNKDPSKPRRWEKLLTLLQKRTSHACLWFGSEMFISGGKTSGTSTSLSVVEVVDIQNITVRVISPLKESREGHHMAVLHGKPAVLGGKLSRPQYAGNINTIETYDAQTDSWVTLNYTLQEKRSSFGLVQYRV